MIQRTACLIARGTSLCRNMAIEKLLMDTLPDQTAILYLNQSDHAIVLGRSQNPWYECKVESFLEAGGIIARRLSGGGAHYLDMGSLNFSFILPKADFNIGRQLGVIGAALAPFGVGCEVGYNGRLTAKGRAFCYSAFYKAGACAIHHGTLLLNTAKDAAEHYLKSKNRPAAEALSPAAAMINLKELNPEITVEGLEQTLYQAFASAFRADPAWLDEQMMDAASLKTLTAQFEDPAWVYPEKRDYDFDVSERFPWGGVTVLLNRENGVIRAAKIFSDAMEAALFQPIEQGLVGCPFLIGAITTRFEQKLELLRDPRLLQIAGDVCTLICGRIRALDRGGHEH